MKILITGGCGFVGSNLAIFLKKNLKNSKIFSLDNLSRNGSKVNLSRLKKNKIKNFKFDIFDFKKLKKLKKFDLIIDCCAEPAIEISKKNPDLVFNTNLVGTFNILKKCTYDNSKLIFLSTSRVYCIEKLNKLIKKKAYNKELKISKLIDEKFSTSSPKSIYGFTKFASEELIQEFNYTNNVQYLINRFGVICGPWQFGKQDQGFVSLWVGRHLKRKNLSYIGYGGFGNQVRDLIHIDDVCEIIFKQIKNISKIHNHIFNIGGGVKNSISLKKLTLICQEITKNKIKIKKIKKESTYDIPYYVTNNSKINNFYKWQPKKSVRAILLDITNWLKKEKKILINFF